MTTKTEMVERMDADKAIAFLKEAARYFQKRSTGGEDKAFWANVYNGKNCERIATLIKAMQQGAPVIDEIRAERERQISCEGWTHEHDDRHTDGSLALAGASYARHAHAHPHLSEIATPADWPWESGWWKPKDRRRDLVRAAALIVAEIERLDRAALSNPTTEGE